MPGKRIFGVPSTQFVPHHLATDWPGYGFLFEQLPSAPCIPPTLEEFRTRFPEFAAVSDARVQMAIDDASCWADSTWLANGCPNCKTAIAYLAAHFLTLQMAAASMLPIMVPEDGEGGGGQIIPGGEVTSISFEGMSVGFSQAKWAGAGGSLSSGTGVGEQFDLSSTPYGQRYVELLKVNQPAVAVV